MKSDFLELDLHLCDKTDTRNLLTDLIVRAETEGIKKIRIIHGKGTSSKKIEVYKILEKDDRIYGYNDDGANWGVTIAHLQQ
ncbi:MAG: Smr/MutS family protein [Spirochaetes bacterium]|nr:Smr/MutS family protein [Spirochaetota bacterium]